MMRATLDARGYQVEVWPFDEKGKLVERGGYAGMKNEFDERGRRISQLYFGGDGSPVNIAGR